MRMLLQRVDAGAFQLRNENARGTLGARSSGTPHAQDGEAGAEQSQRGHGFGDGDGGGAHLQIRRPQGTGTQRRHNRQRMRPGAQGKELPCLMSLFARQGTGSSPQSTTCCQAPDVTPIETPKSNISKASPLSNASTTTVDTALAGLVNVHDGATRNVVGVPELGVQKTPDGSSGKQPAARGARVKESELVPRVQGEWPCGREGRWRQHRAEGRRRRSPKERLER